MSKQNEETPVEILLVEDNPGDVDLTIEALEEGRVANHLSVVEDGAEALAFLRREEPYQDAPRPDLVLLDLNLPGVDGFEVLTLVKQDEQLKKIPIIVMTTSDAEHDILKSYNLHANAYVTKPLDVEEFIEVVRALEDFWLTFVRLP